MKLVVKNLWLVLCLGLLAACSGTRQTDEAEYNRRKIYLTEEDYAEEIGDLQEQRRETQPLVESEYIFNAVPQTDPSIYFFDDRQQPKIPGEPSAADYKREKRLWTKPKRYTPEQYYGMQGEGEAGSSGSSSEASYDSFDFGGF